VSGVVKALGFVGIKREFRVGYEIPPNAPTSETIPTYNETATNANHSAISA
jgi:hypothetical protein